MTNLTKKYLGLYSVHIENPVWSSLWTVCFSLVVVIDENEML